MSMREETWRSREPAGRNRRRIGPSSTGSGRKKAAWLGSHIALSTHESIFLVQGL